MKQQQCKEKPQRQLALQTSEIKLKVGTQDVSGAENLRKEPGLLGF